MTAKNMGKFFLTKAVNQQKTPASTLKLEAGAIKSS